MTKLKCVMKNRISWTFSPPNVHIDASATGTLACPVEQCDGQFVHVEVSALEPVT